MIAGIETGGTKVICAIAASSAPGTIVERLRIPTTSPAETLGAVRSFLERYASAGELDAVGLAAFGPVNVDRSSPSYGWITSTPKAGWRNTDIPRALGLGDAMPLQVVSDVTGSAVGEQRSGAGIGMRNIAYVTVGTGVGAGFAADGVPFLQRSHPEMGHLPVRRYPGDTFPGNCPFHGDCLEGLVSGPAIRARWGRPGEQLGALRSEAVPLLAFYVAQLLAAVTYTVAPDRIVLGGGVLKLPGLLQASREGLAGVVGGALEGHPLTLPGSGYVCSPVLADLAGVHGALFLAHDLAGNRAPLTAV
ncbi:ROK family protein [Arthrobacter citreus]|uniref:ROK family protein n=1 Tax=Arthrobacter TaxID=1663 RepID=UPI001264A614|nr:ROK family protein [Arthrobacter gandavensis]